MIFQATSLSCWIIIERSFSFTWQYQQKY